jgi:hypothetical protein
MTTRADLLGWLDEALQDTDAVLTPTQRDNALERALMQYSARRPQWLVTDLTGNGSTQTWTVPGAWVADWSWIDSVYEIVGSARPMLLDGSEFWVEQTPTGRQWRCIGAPAVGTTLRVRYAALHTATTQTATVPPGDERAVGILGGACALDMLMTRSAAQGDPTLGADTTDHQSRSDRYASCAKRLRELFDTLVPAHTPRRLTIQRA